ncbi:MAG: aldo/keto reductase [Anaerolineales bacterium]|jgi:aryl-alcohol dehydrogenase-like predicted oxidoreductase
MQYRNLGSSGLKISAVGLGTNQFGGKVNPQVVAEIIAAAVDQGINFFDTANTYQGGRSEETIGSAVKAYRRSDLIIATKFYGKLGDRPNDRGGSRKHIMDAVEDSLRRLDTDYIDLYQYHRLDPDTPIEETLRALDDLVTQGKVRYIGSSNFPSWMMALAQKTSEHNRWNRFVSEQPHFHMLEREVEKEVLPAAEYFGIGILPFFPLAGGFLTGKYKRGEGAPQGSRGETSGYVQKYMTDENYTIIEKLTAFAGERGRTMVELAHAWLLSFPQVGSVISGTTRVEHVLANAKSAGWELRGEELEEVNKILGKN